MKTRVHRDKGFAWSALAAVLAVPAVGCLLWIQELRGAAPPATTPKRVVAIQFREPAPPEPAPKPAPAAEIRLQGLIIAENAPRRAIVNGVIVKEGETIDGATVLRIEPSEVLFGSPAGNFTRRLGG